MLEHLSLASRDEILARAGATPLLANDIVTWDGTRHTLREWTRLALEADDPHAREHASKALAHADDVRRPRRAEATGEAQDLASKVRSRGPRSTDSGPDDLVRMATEFLDATTELAQEVVTRVARARAVERPRTALDALVLLRGMGEPWRASAPDRPRRIASMLAPVGLQDEFAKRAKLGSVHRELDWAARVIAIDPPHHVVILPAPLELGLASELSLAHAIGRGLAISLVSPGLPPALRRAWPGSFERGLGELLMGLYADPLFLRRSRGLSGTELEGVARSSLAIVLFRTRMLAARVASSGITGRERIDAGREQLARALLSADASMPDALADASTLAPDERCADLRAALIAPAIALSLRDRFDEDWFRNPRVAEPIRAAAARGGALSIEAWASELGASITRSVEWFATKLE
jgi:hypothetical protein